MDVAFAADRAYLPHAATMARSVLAHTDPGAVRLHLLHPRALDPDDLGRLRAMVESLGSTVATHAIDDPRMAALPATGRISAVMWYRILLPELLPDAPRALYLDCDIVATADLAPLMAVDLEGSAVGAVHNVPYGGADDAARVGLPPGRRYFNSGVLLLDLERWRHTDVTDRLVAFARTEGERLVFPDQDALNVVLADDRAVLHPRWNCQNSLFFSPEAADVFGADVVQAACADPAIVHFEGPALAKPWHYLSPHPHRAAYLRHRAATPWPHGAIEGRTLTNRLLRKLPHRMMLRALARQARRRSEAA